MSKQRAVASLLDARVDIISLDGVIEACMALALTGGSVKDPTPLPSVITDTLTAWGTSGTPLGTRTQPYSKLGGRHPRTSKIKTLSIQYEVVYIQRTV